LDRSRCRTPVGQACSALSGRSGDNHRPRLPDRTRIVIISFTRIASGNASARCIRVYPSSSPRRPGSQTAWNLATTGTSGAGMDDFRVVRFHRYSSPYFWYVMIPGILLLEFHPGPGTDFDVSSQMRGAGLGGRTEFGTGGGCVFAINKASNCGLVAPPPSLGKDQSPLWRTYIYVVLRPPSYLSVNPKALLTTFTSFAPQSGTYPKLIPSATAPTLQHIHTTLQSCSPPPKTDTYLTSSST